MNNNTSDNDTSDPVDRLKDLVVQKACEALENIGKGSSFHDAYNLAKLAIRVTSHHNESKPIEKQPGIRVTSHHNESKPIEKQPVIPPPPLFVAAKTFARMEKIRWIPLLLLLLLSFK
jgi:hypothetical protein